MIGARWGIKCFDDFCIAKLVGFGLVSRKKLTCYFGDSYYLFINFIELLNSSRTNIGSIYLEFIGLSACMSLCQVKG